MRLAWITTEMGRRQGDTDLRTLQRHIYEHEIAAAVAAYENVIQRGRAEWLTQQNYRVRKTLRWWLWRPVTALAFQVMVNECWRAGKMPGPTPRYRGE